MPIEDNLEEGFDPAAELAEIDKTAEKTRDGLNEGAEIRLELQAYPEFTPDGTVHRFSFKDMVAGKKHHQKDYYLTYESLEENPGDKLIRTENGKQITANIPSVFNLLDIVKDYIAEREKEGKTVSCKGLEYFNMPLGTIRGHLVSIRAEMKLPSIYHTNDPRFDAFREGKFDSYVLKTNGK